MVIESFRGHVHAAIGLLTWLPALAVPVLELGGIEFSPAGQAWVSIASGASTFFAVFLYGVAWVRKRPPFDRPRVDTARTAFAMALFAGTGIGAHAGLLRAASFSGGDHVAAIVVYFGLLPAALVLCCPERPLTRAIALIVTVVAGVEVAAQVGLSVSTWQRLRWWDDITGMNAGYLAGALVMTLLWWTNRKLGPGSGRRPRVWHDRDDDDAPPPRAA